MGEINICFVSSEKEYHEKFHDLIEDKQTLKFSLESISFWNRFYSWKQKPLMCINLDGKIVSVLFYNNAKDKYCSIINILTPEKYRRNGFAKILISEAIKQCYSTGAKRIRLNCDNIENTIKFYNRLGFFYWGVTRSNALYCNLPLISGDIEDFKKLKTFSLNNLLDIKSVNLINRRICDDMSSKIYFNMPDYLLQNQYFYNEFLDYKKGNYVRNFGFQINK